MIVLKKQVGKHEVLHRAMDCGSVMANKQEPPRNIMIGTIRPNSKSLDCFELKNFVTQAMCKTCIATGKWFGLTARMGLSHDIIFLATLSADKEFQTAKLSHRPMRCFSSNVDSTSPDAQYLSAATVFTSAIKVNDAIQDNEISGENWINRKIKPIAEAAEKQLLALGLPVAEVKNHLKAYSEYETQKANAEFDDLSKPIAEAYRIVFEHLPSRASIPAQRINLGNIGAQYGTLTLLIDAVEDADRDKEKGRYNIGLSSSNLRGIRAKCLDDINMQFEKLIALVGSTSKTAESYIKAARLATIARLSAKQKRNDRLFTHPISLGMFGLIQRETDCAGNDHYSLDCGGVLCVGAIVVGLCCCCLNKDNER